MRQTVRITIRARRGGGPRGSGDSLERRCSADSRDPRSPRFPKGQSRAPDQDPRRGGHALGCASRGRPAAPLVKPAPPMRSPTLRAAPTVGSASRDRWRAHFEPRGTLVMDVSVPVGREEAARAIARPRLLETPLQHPDVGHRKGQVPRALRLRRPSVQILFVGDGKFHPVKRARASWDDAGWRTASSIGGRGSRRCSHYNGFRDRRGVRRLRRAAFSTRSSLNDESSRRARGDPAKRKRRRSAAR